MTPAIANANPSPDGRAAENGGDPGSIGSNPRVRHGRADPGEGAAEAANRRRSTRVGAISLPKTWTKKNPGNQKRENNDRKQDKSDGNNPTMATGAKTELPSQ
jgi:hypothetical protein